MPAENVRFKPRHELLTFEEIERFVRVVARLGVDKIRLTGGEPLVRHDLPVLVEKLAGIDGIRDIALTTNGILLAEQAQALKDAGLQRLNISLDSLEPRNVLQDFAPRGARAGAGGHLRGPARRASKKSGSTPWRFAASPSPRSCRWASSPGSMAWKCDSSSSCRWMPRATGTPSRCLSGEQIRADARSGNRAAGAAAGRRSQPAGDRLCLCRRRGPHRFHQSRDAAVLPPLQSPAADGRRPGAQLPVFDRGMGRPGAAARRRHATRSWPSWCARASAPRAPATASTATSSSSPQRAMYQIGG